jgi:raffinose/stachyose/melibiose transport system permease protein|tara:strand:- start:503 stop:1339 length:837 start_codon:yes stop_codon:yes gene_type:complete
MRNLSSSLNSTIMHLVLISYTLICLFPVYLLVGNSFKSRRAIFKQPLSLPNEETFSLAGYLKMFSRIDFSIYFYNSTFVTIITLFFVLFFGAMAAWALSEYKFRGNMMLGLYLAFGIMIPIKLGTVSILQLMNSLNLVNTLTGLVIIYIAQSLPLAIWILSEFMKQLNNELKEAARCDGVNEYQLFFYIVLPLLRPPMATVAVFTMVPVWNDLWWPLILAPSGGKQTVILGMQQYIGQYVTNWNAIFASLSMALIPVIIFYLIFSRQLIRSITSGAVK